MDMLVSQAPGIGQGPFQKGHDVFCRKLLENKNLAAGQKGTIYFKGRVFRRRPDKMMLPFSTRVGRRPAGPC